MAIDSIGAQLPVINESQLYSKLWDTLPKELLSKFSLIMDLGKIVLIVTIIYLIVIIIGKILMWRDSINLKKIAKNVEEINGKLSQLTSRTKHVNKSNDEVLKKEQKK